LGVVVVLGKGIRERLTQNSAAAPLGRGSFPSRTLREKRKKNSRRGVRCGWKRTSGYLDMTLSMKVMPLTEISVSASGSGVIC
jgi:hypothetical protein